jgi:hypothetical protein
VSDPDFASCVQEARRVVARTGTWLLHEARDAENLTELVGFLRYTSRGLEARAKRTHRTDRRDLLRAWAGTWRRANRWVMGLDPAQAREIAIAVLRQVDEPFYVPCGHPWLTVDDEPPRPPGRPRVRAAIRAYPECTACHGLGFR